MKKLKLILVFSLVFGLLATPLNNEIKAANQTYSGEELFKGFVFAQGDVGKKLDKSFDKETAEKLNAEEGYQYSEGIVNKIKAEDPEFFTKFQEAVYDNDPLRVENLLTDSGNILKEEINNAESNYQLHEEVAGAGENVSVVNVSVLAVVAAAVLVVVATLIDFTPVAAKQGISKEMAVKELLEEV